MLKKTGTGALTALRSFSNRPGNTLPLLSFHLILNRSAFHEFRRSEVTLAERRKLVLNFRARPFSVPGCSAWGGALGAGRAEAREAGSRRAQGAGPRGPRAPLPPPPLLPPPPPGRSGSRRTDRPGTGRGRQRLLLGPLLPGAHGTAGPRSWPLPGSLG